MNCVLPEGIDLNTLCKSGELGAGLQRAPLANVQPAWCLASSCSSMVSPTVDLERL